MYKCDMPFVVIMHVCLESRLARAASMHHADSLGVYPLCRVGMILECRPGELIARTACMHHDDRGHTTLIEELFDP